MQRSRLAEQQNHSAEYRYRTQRMELLLEAQSLCIELVYYNALGALYGRQLENAERIAHAYERRQQTGDANRLEYNKAQLNLTNRANEVRRIDLERARLLSELTRLNGGNPVEFDRSAYAPVSALPPDFETWYATAEAENPALQYLRSQVEVGSRQIRVSRASTLPKFSVGYMGEFVTGQQFQGVTAGISIPLWENRNRVRQAKAAARSSERVAEDAKTQYYTHLKTLYAQITELQRSIRQYDSVFGQHGNEELLFRAYESGEISLLDYLLELEYYFVACDKRLQAERDLQLAMAQLLAFSL